MASDDELRQIIERIDALDARRTFWGHVSNVGVPLLVAAVALIGALVGSWLSAQATVRSSDRQAESTRESNEQNIVSQRDSFVAAQRRDSYATLGRTVRENLRSLQLARGDLALGRVPGPPRTVSFRVGTAYRTTRSAAVDTELVGDNRAGQMARCLVSGFVQIGEDMEYLKQEVGAGRVPTAALDEARRSMDELQQYEFSFIQYGRAHLFPSATEADEPPGGRDPDCPWGA